MNVDKDTAKNIMSITMPALEYAAVVWSPYEKMQQTGTGSTSGHYLGDKFKGLEVRRHIEHIRP